jgi:hypothetical protein
LIARRSIIAIFAIGLTLALAANSAGAATRLGSTCTSNSDASGYIVIDPATGTSTTGGVITRWGMTSGTSADYYSLQLVVLSATGAPNIYSIVSSSAVLPVVLGANSVASQISIKPGQLIGSFGPGAGAMTCYGESATARVVPASSPLTPGTVLPASLAIAAAPAIYADVEADIDADGFGDESQDLCPQSAKFQIACANPVLTVKKLSTKTSFKAIVSADIATAVTSVATVKLPAKTNGKAKTLTLKSKLINATPGVKKQLTIKYSNSLKNALAALSKKKSLKLKVAVTAAGLIGNDVEKLTVKLRGTK